MTESPAEAEKPVEANPDVASAEPRIRRVRWAAFAVAGVVLAGGLGTGYWLRRDGDALPRLKPEVTYTLESMTPSKNKFTLGVDILAAGQELEIVSVTALTSPNVEYLGAFAAWPRDHEGGAVYSGGSGYPSKEQPKRHPLHQPVPAAETALVPKGFEGTQPVTVNAGFQLISGGVGAVNGVTVVYKLDGDTKREHYRYAVVGCMKTQKNCNRNLEDSNFTSDVLERYGLVKD